MARISNNTLILDGQSLGATFTSDPVSLIHIFGYSVSVNVLTASSPIGVLTLEVSNDSDPAHPGVNSAVWQTLPGSTQAVAAAAGDNYLWNVKDVYYRYVRVKYTRTSGSGTANVRINVKGL